MNFYIFDDDLRKFVFKFSNKGEFDLLDICQISLCARTKQKQSKNYFFNHLSSPFAIEIFVMIHKNLYKTKPKADCFAEF